jgi:hypothetical protein
MPFLKIWKSFPFQNLHYWFANAGLGAFARFWGWVARFSGGFARFAIWWKLHDPF